MPVNDNYDALIIGAGIAGAAVGERLFAHGIKKVLLLEKEPMPGTGSTGRSAGGIRQQFGDEAKIRAARFGFRIFDSFEERFGIDPTFRKHGYLILQSEEDSARKLQKDVELQRRMGLDARFLKPQEAADMAPSLFTEDLKGAAFNGSDGYLDPHALVQGYLKAFRDRGGIIEYGVKAERILVNRGRVEGVLSTNGEFFAGCTVLAAGPHASGLLAPLGIHLPLRTCRRQIFSTGPVREVPSHWPLILDPDAPFYFRPEGEGLLMSLAEVEEMPPPEEGNDIPVTRDNLLDLAQRATHRCPPLEAAKIRSGWAGLRTITPDQRPLLGGLSGFEGLQIAAGFSGHGITLAPFAAEFLAREVVGRPFEGECRIPFLASRFE